MEVSSRSSGRQGSLTFSPYYGLALKVLDPTFHTIETKVSPTLLVCNAGWLLKYDNADNIIRVIFAFLRFDKSAPELQKILNSFHRMSGTHHD